MCLLLQTPKKIYKILLIRSFSSTSKIDQETHRKENRKAINKQEYEDLALVKPRSPISLKPKPSQYKIVNSSEFFLNLIGFQEP